MSRTFKVDDLCLYRGKICRVLEVEPNLAKGLGYMGIKDGTEFNPFLTLLPLYGVDNKRVKTPREVIVVSGSVESAADTLKKLKRDIEHSQERIRLLEQG